jgi:hypothetical protein
MGTTDTDHTVHNVRSRPSRAYFVGRREFESAEVYRVTIAEVERIRPDHPGRAVNLDWAGDDSALLELSHVLLSMTAERAPSSELEAGFALLVLAELPEEGFVLDCEEIRRWLRIKDM